MEIDIVDDNNKVIGTSKKDSNHHFRSVHIWVFSKNGELLLSKRPKEIKRFPNMTTSSAGGHLDSGETYKQGAARELKEELGISTNLTFCCTFVWKKGKQKVFHELYSTISDGPFALDKREISETRFISLKEMYDEVAQHPEQFAPPFLEAVKAFRSLK